MKKITKIIVLNFLVLPMFFASTSYALLNSYVNIQGTTNVAGPQFYIGSASEENLLINETSSNCSYFKIDNIYRSFKTDSLEGMDFNYSPKIDLSVRAKVSSTTPQNLILNFGYIDIYGVIHEMYSENVLLTDSMQNHKVGFQGGGEIPQNVENLYYEFKKDCLDCDYSISKCASGFYTKAELRK